MTENPLTWLIYNGSSGSFDRTLLGEVTVMLRDAGYALDRVTDCCESDNLSAEDASRAGVELIAILGGDGTLSRTIAGLEGFDGAVLALPGGTFNLLCRTIFGERDPLEILKDFSDGRLTPQRRACIRSDGGLLALSEVLAGPGATWADVREEMRDGNIPELLAKSIEAASESTAGPMVVVVDPPRGRPEGYSGVRIVPGPSGMAIAGYGVEGFLTLLQQGAAILARDFRAGPHDDLATAEKVVCRSVENAPIPLMIDGERSEGGPQVAFSLDTLGVDLLGPADGR